MAFKFLSLFNDLLIPNHRSLNFRALIFAAMLVAKKMLQAAIMPLLRKLQARFMAQI